MPAFAGRAHPFPWSDQYFAVHGNRLLHDNRLLAAAHAQAGAPRHEALLEQDWIERVERVVARHAAGEGLQPAQETQVRGPTTLFPQNRRSRSTPP